MDKAIVRSEEETVWRKVFSQDADTDGECIGLHGPHNIGKTYLISRLVSRFEQKDHPFVYCFNLSLKNYTTSWSLWFDLFEQMRVVLTPEVLEQAPRVKGTLEKRMVNELIEIFERIKFKSASSFDDDVRTYYFNTIFKYLRVIGIRLIIIIDEFDEAKVMCKDGFFFNQLFGLSRKALTKNNHSIILVSRRSLLNIEHHMAGGSSLADAYDGQERAVTLSGFNDQQMEEYFAKFPCKLNEEQKNDIVFYCGRNPGLLRTMLDSFSPTGTIQTLFKRQEAKSFRTVYKETCHLMKDEKLDNGLRCFDVYVEEFIGPITSISHKNDMEFLESMGFVTRVSNDNCAFRMTDTEYEPLSPMFIQYIAERELSGDTNHASLLLINTEIQFRRALHSFGLHVYGNIEKWMEELDLRLKTIKPQKCALHDTFYESYQRACSENAAFDRVITGTKLDVISISDLYELTKYFGTPLEGLLKDLPVYSDETEEDFFGFLTLCRNLDGHRNLQVLDSIHVKRLISTCDVLLTRFREIIPVVLQQDADELLLQIPSLELETPKPVVSDDNLSSQNMDMLIGKEVTLVNGQQKKKGNISGFIEGYGYAVTISKSYAQQIKGKYTYEIGRGICILVLLERWDNNPVNPHFDSIPIDLLNSHQ